MKIMSVDLTEKKTYPITMVGQNMFKFVKKSGFYIIEKVLNKLPLIPHPENLVLLDSPPFFSVLSLLSFPGITNRHCILNLQYLKLNV